MFFSVFSHGTRIAGARGHMRSFAMSIYSGNVVSKDALKSFPNLLQGGDGTSAKKLDEDLDIFWASKGGYVDLSKWSKDDCSTGLIPDYIDCKYFASKPVVTSNFALCFAAKEKFYRHFLATEKKISVTSWRLLRKVNFGLLYARLRT